MMTSESEKEKKRSGSAKLPGANNRPKAGGVPKIITSMDIQRTVREGKGQWVLFKEPQQRLVVMPILPPVSHWREAAYVPWAFSQYVSPRLQGVFVTAGTRGRFVREKPRSVFTRRGVICQDVGDAAQMAWVPLGHIVKPVAGGLRERRFEDFLVSANGEPLGPPVCVDYLRCWYINGHISHRR